MTLDGALNWNRRCETSTYARARVRAGGSEASSVVGAHWVSDRDCRAHGDCNENQYESEAPTATSDRGCSLFAAVLRASTRQRRQHRRRTGSAPDIQDCDDMARGKTEYQTAAPTKTSNACAHRCVRARQMSFRRWSQQPRPTVCAKHTRTVQIKRVRVYVS